MLLKPSRRSATSESAHPNTVHRHPFLAIAFRLLALTLTTGCLAVVPSVMRAQDAITAAAQHLRHHVRQARLYVQNGTTSITQADKDRFDAIVRDVAAGRIDALALFKLVYPGLTVPPGARYDAGCSAVLTEVVQGPGPFILNGPQAVFTLGYAVSSGAKFELKQERERKIGADYVKPTFNAPADSAFRAGAAFYRRGGFGSLGGVSALRLSFRHPDFFGLNLSVWAHNDLGQLPPGPIALGTWLTKETSNPACKNFPTGPFVWLQMELI